MTLKTEIMNLIAEQLDEIFGNYYEGEWVAVTYSGGIILIEKDSVTLLKKLDEMKIPSEAFFIHEIGGSRH